MDREEANSGVTGEAPCVEAGDRDHRELRGGHLKREKCIHTAQAAILQRQPYRRHFYRYSLN